MFGAFVLTLTVPTTSGSRYSITSKVQRLRQTKLSANRVAVLSTNYCYLPVFRKVANAECSRSPCLMITECEPNRPDRRRTLGVLHTTLLPDFSLIWTHTLEAVPRYL